MFRAALKIARFFYKFMTEEINMADHIQVQDIVPRIQYTADGINKAFETPFVVFNEDSLDVYLNEDKITQGFSVEMDEDLRAEVNFEEAPQNGTLVTLVRHLPIFRTSDFQEGGSLRANTLNYELDYQMACLQELADNINRSMVLPPYAINSDAQLTLPLPDPGKAIIWTADGKSLENSSVNINAVSSELDTKVAQSSQNATAAQNSAQVATQMAQVAQSQAGIAGQKAQVATQKAQEASTALVGKTNVDMDNLTTDGKSMVSSLSMPSDEYIDLTLKASDSDYSAPGNGYYCIYKTAGTSQSGGYVVFENKTTGIKDISTPTPANSAGILFPIRKNDVLNIKYTVSGATQLFRFYYTEGEI